MIVNYTRDELYNMNTETLIALNSELVGLKTRVELELKARGEY